MFTERKIKKEQLKNAFLSSDMVNITPLPKLLSGSALKVLAVVSMLVDHTASWLLRYLPAGWKVLFTIGSHELTLYSMMRYFGRLAFPIAAEAGN